MRLLISRKLIASFTLALLLLIAISAVSRGSGARLLALALVGLSGVAIYRDIVRRARAEMALRESEARYRSLIAALSEGAVVCSFADITERKQAEEALRAAEERFRKLVEQLPAITYVAALDEESSTIYTSPQIETMLGFSQAEWMADHQLWRKQIHPDDYERVMADVLQSQASGVPVPSEYRMITRDGRDKWFRDQAVMVRNQAGQPLFMQGIMFDITERKLAEAALRASESRNRALLDAIPDLMFRLSRDGVYLDVQPDDAGDLALPPGVLLGKTVYDALPADVADRIMGCVAQALRTEVVQVTEYQLILEHGRRDFEARIVVCAENEALAIVRDITERKNIERMKNEFVSTVSHELRTPLTSIRGSLGLMAGGVAGELPAKARAMVDIAYKNSERLVRLINDILDIEKIESGKMKFNLQPIELLPLVEHAIEINRAYGQQLDVTFALERAIAGAWVHADSDRLVQALTNLLGNAAKFSPPGARVLVSLIRSGETLRIAIQDRGPGIPDAFRERLFDKFAQADASDARKKGGTGLGLSITKAIVERMGGHVDVTTAPGSGSTFFIDLPEWRTPDLASGGSPAARLLICERDREVAAVLAAMLRQSGFSADIACAVEETQQRLMTGAYAALVVDLMLAGEEALALIDSLRGQEATRGLPIVVISARAASHDLALRGATLVPHAWPNQPIDPQRLIDVLKWIVRPDAFRPRILHIHDEVDSQHKVAPITGDVADVIPVATLDQARRKLSEERFDLLILDLDLPDGSCLALLRDLGATEAMAAPVVVFSVREISRDIPNVAATLMKAQTFHREPGEAITALNQSPSRPGYGGER